MTIAELLRTRAEQTPAAPGYFHEAGGAWVGWSWEDYWQNACKAAAGLRAAGIGPGDHVLMLVSDVHTAVPTLFGVWAVGGVPIQVGVPYRLQDPAAFLAELGRTAERLSAKALVVPEAMAGAAPNGLATLAAEALLREDAATDPGGPDSPDAPALIQLTSGSTGHPRGVVISHARLLEHLASISKALPLAGEDAAEVSWLPLHHDMGLIGGLLFPLFNGFPLYHLSPLAFRNNPFSWLETISTARATCTPAPPSAYAIALRLAARAEEANLDLSSLACAMIGAEPISARLLRSFAAAFEPCGLRPEAFFPVYGLAEATVAVTFPKLLDATHFDRIDRSILEREGRAVPGGENAIELVGVGRPLPGTEIRIVTEGKPAGPRQVGEITVRSTSLMDGYYGDPDATAEVMEDGWLKTGDLGYLAEDDLFVTGRVKELIIKGGHNLLPAVIEEIAGGVEGIRAGCVAAVGVPSEDRATELVYVVAETKLDPSDHKQLGAEVREALRLRGIAVDRVVLVPPGGVPKTTSGKIRRGEIARMLLDPEDPLPTTVCEAFQITASRQGDRPALRTRGDEVSITWSEYAERVRDLAAGLAALGLGRGDTLAMMLVNRPEFHLVDTAAIHLGAVPFSLYNSSSPEQIEYLLNDSGCRIVVTEQAFLDSVERARQGCPSIEHVFVVDGTPSLADLEHGGAPDFDFDAAWRAVQPSDLLTLIYTSGTTGPPKGVEITHANYLAEWHGFEGIADFQPGRVVSYFPMAHIAERVVSHYNSIAYGHTVTCCPDPRQVTAYLPEARPTFFFAVPRIWEKVKAALEVGIARDALEVGLRKVRAEQAGEEVPEELAAAWAQADQAVFSKIRERLGLDQAEHILTGAAPSPVEVLEFFHAIGIEILEVWGLSETCGLATANPPGRAKLGTVGPAATGVELRIADDGEVLVRSGIVMAGYRHQPAKTAEAIDADGWFHTGDVGELDDDGYLRIVDRKKEIIINAAGENMSPANIEAQVKSSSPLIGQACVVGDRRPYTVALIVLDPDGAAAFAEQRGLEDASPASLARDDAVIEEVGRGVERANSRLSRPEQIKRFRVLGTEWEAAGDELTPTLKLKREAVAQKYGDEIETLYAEDPA